MLCIKFDKIWLSDLGEEVKNVKRFANERTDDRQQVIRKAYLKCKAMST